MVSEGPRQVGYKKYFILPGLFCPVAVFFFARQARRPLETPASSEATHYISLPSFVPAEMAQNSRNSHRKKQYKVYMEPCQHYWSSRDRFQPPLVFSHRRLHEYTHSYVTVVLICVTGLTLTLFILKQLVSTLSDSISFLYTRDI